MATLNSIFDQIFVINLERDAQKMYEIDNRLSRFDIQYERFNAIDGVALNIGGTEGCRRSHIAIIEEAKRRSLDRILILEDDILLHKDFVKRFEEVYDRITKSGDDDWGFLYLGVFYYELFDKSILNKPENSKYFLGNQCVGGFAVGIDHSLYDKIIERSNEEKYPIDISYMNLQDSNKSIIFNPHLITALVNKKSNTMDGGNQYISQNWFCDWNRINIMDFDYEKLYNFNWAKYVTKYGFHKKGMRTYEMALNHYINYGIAMNLNSN